MMKTTSYIQPHKNRLGSIHFNSRFLYALALILLWFLYNIERIYSGYNLVSDEVFYFFTDSYGESRRLYFIWMVQLFEDKDISLVFLTSVNILCVIGSYFLLVRIFFNNASVSFFHLIYFAAVASFAFRDSIILLLFCIITYGALFQSKRFSFVVIVAIALMWDFRFHYLLYMIVAVVGAWASTTIKNGRVLFALALVFLSIGFVLIPSIGENYNLYGITLREYVQLKEDRWDYVLTPISFVYGSVVHIFAPLPTSLVERIIGLTDEISLYGRLDDIYRLIYKFYIYWAVFFLVLNTRNVIQFYERHRFTAMYFTIFSLLNLGTYVIVGFAGSHERVKVFSTLFISFLVSGIIAGKKLKRDRNGASGVQI